ncbi:hypothetical protein [Emticicia sp. 17c]|uniref:hypothetical protein n=1 Tax=Emticicia sp. 17c TaxID=3127704 RepID=UPI00301C0577
MKNLFKITAVAIMCLFFAENTQAQAFDKGTKNLNVGLGLGYGIGVNASFDVGIHELISVGVMGGYNVRHYGFGWGNYNVSSTAVGARGALHFGKFVNEALNIDDNKFDPYVGIGLGVKIQKYSDSYTNYYNYSSTYTNPVYIGYLGARYYFKEKLGVYAELGFPYNSFGVTFKF